MPRSVPCHCSAPRRRSLRAVVLASRRSPTKSASRGLLPGVPPRTRFRCRGVQRSTRESWRRWHPESAPTCVRSGFTRASRPCSMWCGMLVGAAWKKPSAKIPTSSRRWRPRTFADSNQPASSPPSSTLWATRHPKRAAISRPFRWVTASSTTFCSPRSRWRCARVAPAR